MVCNNCSCVSSLTLEDVLENGYWPASPNNLTTLFAQNLFFTWDIFQKRMPGCSETSFVKSLEDISIAKGRVLNFSCYVLCDATVDETVPIVPDACYTINIVNYAELFFFCLDWYNQSQSIHSFASMSWMFCNQKIGSVVLVVLVINILATLMGT